MKKFSEFNKEELTTEQINFFKLFDLIEVSNNSILTGEVYNMLKEKLSTEDIVKFKQWLKIIKRGY